MGRSQELWVFLKAGSTKATIQRLWQGMPNTPGKEQEVVGVKVIPAASCYPQSHAGAASLAVRWRMSTNATVRADQAI